MKKILIAFDGIHYSKGAFEFARRLNELQPILLTGVFLPQVDFSNALSYAQGGAAAFIPLVEGYNAELVQQQVQIFEEACVRHQIEFRIHKERYDFAMPELKKETRFADLLLLGSEKFYGNLGTKTPNDYLRMALHEAECPVILAPEDFKFPESNVLSYDGSEDAAFAIKSFHCLFPELCDNKTILVYATEKRKAEIPEMDYMKELSARHFSNLTMQILEADPKKYFGTWINDIKNPILVCGSFGRSGISQTFKHSFISEVINDHKIPIFITHR
jgi:nucleotide-binding universal stress UspA family protein